MEGFQNDLCLFDFRVGNRLYKELVGVDYLSLELKKGFEILEWKYGSKVKSLVQIDSSVCFPFLLIYPCDWLIYWNWFCVQLLNYLFLENMVLEENY